jgi:hypothetical protein
VSRFHILRNQTRFGRYRGCLISVSCFALPDSFSTVARTLCPVGIFCTHGHVFGGNESVRVRFHILRKSDSFRAVPRAPDPIFMFCVPKLVFNDSDDLGSHWHILRSLTHFWRYRGRRGSFSCFALPDSFVTVPMSLGLIFMFCAPGLISGGTAGVGYRFQVLRTRAHFRRYRGCRGSFSCFEVPNSFWAVPKPSGLVFKFCAPGHVFGGTEGVGSLFHVLCSWTLFVRYRGRRVSFSSFALPDSFSTVLRASGLVFMFCAPGLFLGVTEGVGAHFQVLRSWTRFWRYRGRRVLFFKFCASEHFLGAVVHFRRYRGRQARFHVLQYQTLFGRYRGRRGTFSSFALPNTFLAVSRPSGLNFMICAPELFLSVTEGAGSCFHVLPSRTSSGRYRVRRVPFSSFSLPDSFVTVPKASGLIFMFCAPRIISDGTAGVK